MTASLVDGSSMQDNDFICVSNGGQSMSDDKRGAATGPELPDDVRLGACIHGAGCLIEDEQARLAH